MNHQISPNRSQYKSIKRFMAKIIFLGSFKAFNLRFCAEFVYFTCRESNTKFIQKLTVIPIGGSMKDPNEGRPIYIWQKWSNIS